jgi:FkbM family methyltransferase
MSIRKHLGRRMMKMFRSANGQKFLDRWAGRLDIWRGYGAGAYVKDSGEALLFDLLARDKTRSEKIIVFDVGANNGDFTAAALHALGSNVLVYAFEPAREVFARFTERFAGNSQVIANNVALGRASEERALFALGSDTGMASLVQRRLSDGESSKFQETVKVLSLNDYCATAGIDRINLLKIDVEGLELEVLRGAKALFDKEKIDICSFEFGGCNLDSRTYLRDFFEFFRGYDMRIFRITPAATIVELPRYHEQLERFTTTNYVVTRKGPPARPK